MNAVGEEKERGTSVLLDLLAIERELEQLATFFDEEDLLEDAAVLIGKARVNLVTWVHRVAGQSDSDEGVNT